MVAAYPLQCNLASNPRYTSYHRGSSMPDDDGKLTSSSISAMVMYSMSSASMLLINKLCLKALPLPGLVSTAQFVFSAVAILLIKVCGVAPVDDFEWKKVRRANHALGLPYRAV